MIYTCLYCQRDCEYDPNGGPQACPHCQTAIGQFQPAPIVPKRKHASLRAWLIFLGPIAGIVILIWLAFAVPELGQVLLGVAAVVGVILIYFLPAIVAHQNHKRNEQAIIILNLLLGWTLLGWVAALVWATTKD